MLDVNENPTVGELEQIETGGIDLSEFEGKKAKIEKTEVVEVQSKFSESGRQKVLKVSTETITKTKNQEGEDIEISASELFNLVEKDGKTGWSNNPQAKLNKLLLKYGVERPEQLIGKEITLRARDKVQEDGSKTTFLGFIV